MGGASAVVCSYVGVDGVEICLVNIGMDVGYGVMGAVFVTGLLGCVVRKVAQVQIVEELDHHLLKC